MPGPGVTASTRAAARYRASWVRSGMTVSLFRGRPDRGQPPGSGRDQGGNLPVGDPIAGREPRRDPGPILGGPVLAHLALALDARDRHPQTDDPPQLRTDERLRRVRDGPWLGAGPLVQGRQPRNHAEQ